MAVVVYEQVWCSFARAVAASASVPSISFQPSYIALWQHLYMRPFMFFSILFVLHRFPTSLVVSNNHHGPGVGMSIFARAAACRDLLLAGNTCHINTGVVPFFGGPQNGGCSFWVSFNTT